MNATVTRALVATVAGLAIVADAFMLFVKPHMRQQAVADAGSAAPISGGTSGNANGNSDDANTDSTNTDSTNNSTNDAAVSAMQDGTYTTVASPNKYGDVQLSVTVSGGRISAISAISYPNETSRSQSISAQAIPALIDRAISAQSSDIQFVSGATETSTAFANSLQDGINQALNAGK